MPVPHRIYPEIQEKNDVWEGKRGLVRNHQDTLRVQKGGNHRRSGVHGSCAFVREYPAENQSVGVHGLSQREVSADDIRQASGDGEQVQSAFLGKRILCCDSGGYNRRNSKEIYRGATRSRPKRRQSTQLAS